MSRKSSYELLIDILIIGVAGTFFLFLDENG